MAVLRLCVLLATVTSALSGAQTSQTTLVFAVPDESVLPDWSATFSSIYAQMPSPSVKLKGAQDCKFRAVWLKDKSFIANYECFFTPSGPSKADMQSDYLHLIRLVEKVMNATADMKSADESVTPTFERHGVIISSGRFSACCGVGVTEQWLSQTKELSLEKGNRPLEELSRLRVSVWSLPINPQTTSRPAESAENEVDTILKSGRYTSMPPSQRVGSTGSGLASIDVTNDTAYLLTIIYETDSPRTFTIPAHQKATIQLPSGSFRVLGRVAAPGVMPFAGTQVFGPGDKFETRFFIDR